MAETFAVTDRTEVRRLPARATYDKSVADAILDEALVCHLGFADADGHPVVIPTTFARDGDVVYVHGSPASRTLRALASGVPVCITVTLIDGLVLAKSAFHHSINYRSVVIFGMATPVTDDRAKRRALDLFVEHIVPGRTADARGGSDKELKGTLVLRVPLAEVSVKVRTGGPIDDEEDLDLPAWAGVVPIQLVAGPPEAEGTGQGDAPDYVVNYARPSRTS
jgi:nitroimidazol reductase NimA-like FMN-containing flavoprotein (pyridoxamine 5'-phosphate oxidase superfamily)